MSHQSDSDVEPKEAEEQPSVSQRGLKLPTIMVVVVFYAILFCLVTTGFIIAFSLAN